MCKENDSLDTHDTMEFVERPWGKKVIPVHWIYSVKVDEFGNVTRFNVTYGSAEADLSEMGEIETVVSNVAIVKPKSITRQARAWISGASIYS